MWTPLLRPEQYITIIIYEQQWRKIHLKDDVLGYRTHLSDDRMAFYVNELLDLRLTQAEIMMDSKFAESDSVLRDNSKEYVELFIDIFTRTQVEIHDLQDETICQRIEAHEKALGILRAQIHSCHKTIEERLKNKTEAERNAYTIMARKYKVRPSPFDKVAKPKKTQQQTIDELRAQIAKLSATASNIDDED
jgi:hypothetical protein